MTSTPLTLIEGAFALPRLRPLDRLPESLGRDWALLPLGQRCPAELESLYAALLRTVCTTDQQLLSFGQWACINDMPVRPQRPAAQTGAVPTQHAGARPHTTAPARPAAQWKVPPGPMRIALKPRAPRIVKRRFAWRRRMVAASVSAIGCVAVLLWWVVAPPLAPRQMVFTVPESAHAPTAHPAAKPEAPVIAGAGTPRAVPPPSTAASLHHITTQPEPAPRKAPHSPSLRPADY